MDNRSRPVAIPARLSDADGNDPRVGGANRLFHDVVALVEAAGLETIIVSNLDEVNLDEISGVVLPGGGDIDPAHYGGEPCEAVYDINPLQDALDFGLAHDALARGLPALGICRGAQVLNVVAGGTLISDLPPGIVAHVHTPTPGEELAFLWHPVNLTASRLRKHLKTEVITVGSGHHQGIDRLGDGLRATARADDGLIEAFEDAAGRVIGVQWHPEAAETPIAEQNAPFSVFARAISELEGVTHV